MVVKFKKKNKMTNNHKNLDKPWYVAKNLENTVFFYGKIKINQVFSSSMPIKTYVHKQSMIDFIEINGGTYIEQEL